MISLFTIASNDQSLYYLGQIFGSIGTVLPSASLSILIGQMFATLNTTALVLGSILVVHTTVMGLIKTAAEGEFLGKQWSSLWVPLRMVMGISLLFPSSGGYCAVQVIMMWFILQGVGAADTLWTKVIKTLTVTGSPYASIDIPTIAASSAMPTLFKALTCQATAKLKDTKTYPGSGADRPYYYCADSAHSGGTFCAGVLDANAGQILDIKKSNRTQVSKVGNQLQYAIGPDGACGYLSYDDPDTACPTSAQGSAAPTPAADLKCKTAKAQQNALQQIVATYGVMGNDIATADKDYLNFYENSALPDPSKTPTWIVNYCASPDVNIPSQNCCIFNQAPTASLLTSALPPVCYDNNNPTKSPSQFRFPNDKGVTGSATDYTFPSNDAINKVYWPFYTQLQSDIAGTPMNPTDIVGGGVAIYKAALASVVQDWLSAQINNSTPEAGSWQQTAEQQGWVMAGAYYYKIAQMNNGFKTDSMPTFAMTTGSYSRVPDPGTMGRYRNNYSTVDAILALAAPAGSSSAPQLGAAGAGLSSVSGSIADGFTKMLTGSATNPVVSLQSFGQSLIITAEATYLAFLGVSIALLIVSNINVIALGTGLTAAPANEMMKFVLTNINSILMAFMVWAFAMGGTLAVYTPLIPYVMFIFAALGWIIAVVEAMVAGPFIALGILAPGGQSEIMGHAHPAVMMLLNLFLRPSLMIMGMMFGMLMAPVAVTMINSGFKTVMATIAGDTPDPVSFVMFLLAYVALVLAVLNKCFAMISWLPNHVLAWIGHTGTAYGEAEGLDKISGAVGAGAAAASDSAKGVTAGGGMLKGGADAHKKGTDKKEELEKKANDAAGGAGTIDS